MIRQKIKMNNLPITKQKNILVTPTMDISYKLWYLSIKYFLYWILNEDKDEQFRIYSGIKFHCAGPIKVNEFWQSLKGRHSIRIISSKVWMWWINNAII